MELQGGENRLFFDQNPNIDLENGTYNRVKGHTYTSMCTASVQYTV